MSEIKNCPFCNEGVIYEISREDYLGTVIPQLFCNSCKMFFEVENDSPYLDDKKTEEYLREKLYRQFNTRKPMQEIVERLEERRCEYNEELEYDISDGIKEAIEICKEVGGIE